jgi:hypothetical protein
MSDAKNCKHLGYYEQGSAERHMKTANAYEKRFHAGAEKYTAYLKQGA